MALIEYDDLDLKACKTTLKEVSLDKHSANPGEIEFMTNSLLPVFNLDQFKDSYFNRLSCSSVARSVDALYVDSTGRGTLIEFKNGYIDKAKSYEILKKVYDSLFMLGDRCNFHASTARKELSFILVYNKEKNYEAENYKPGEPKREKHYDEFVDSMSKLAESNIKKFRVNALEGYCLNEVKTFSQDEFENEFVSLHTT